MYFFGLFEIHISKGKGKLLISANCRINIIEIEEKAINRSNTQCFIQVSSI